MYVVNAAGLHTYRQNSRTVRVDHPSETGTSAFPCHDRTPVTPSGKAVSIT
jgi:hypothetical protein